LKARQQHHPSHSGGFLRDLAVLDPKSGRSGKMHLSSRIHPKIPHERIHECRADMSTAPFQTDNDVVALCDEVRGAMEFETVKSPMELDQQVFDAGPTTPGCLQQKLKEDVGRREIVHNPWSPGAAPDTF
jgi:hypothetical protein